MFTMTVHETGGRVVLSIADARTREEREREGIPPLALAMLPRVIDAGEPGPDRAEDTEWLAGALDAAGWTLLDATAPGAYRVEPSAGVAP